MTSVHPTHLLRLEYRYREQARLLQVKDAQYAEGWSDGFRQCKAMRESEERIDYRDRHWDERERAWQHEKDQGAARAYHSL